MLAVNNRECALASDEARGCGSYFCKDCLCKRLGIERHREGHKNASIYTRADLDYRPSIDGMDRECRLLIGAKAGAPTPPKEFRRPFNCFLRRRPQRGRRR